MQARENDLIFTGKVGGRGGDAFNFWPSNGSGGAAVKYELWGSGTCLRGIRVHFSDGGVQTTGTIDVGERKVINIGNRTIKELCLWGNGIGTRSGGLKIVRSDDTTFHHQWGGKDEYHKNVGSGICVGIYGRSGWDIDNLGFVFLPEVEYCEHFINKAVTYGNHKVPKRCSLVRIDNRQGCVTGQMTYKVTQKVTNKSKLQHNWNLNLEAGVSVGAKLIGAEVKASFKFAAGYGGSYITETEEECTMEYVVPVNVPRQNFDISATYTEYFGTVRYGGYILCHLRGGREFKIPLKGVFHGVKTSEVFISINGQKVPCGPATRRW